jgi:hypothetical protein
MILSYLWLFDVANEFLRDSVVPFFDDIWKSVKVNIFHSDIWYNRWTPQPRELLIWRRK